MNPIVCLCQVPLWEGGSLCCLPFRLQRFVCFNFLIGRLFRGSSRRTRSEGTLKGRLANKFKVVAADPLAVTE